MVRIWADDDMVELAIEVADGHSRFANTVYVGYQTLMDTIACLQSFRTAVYGGLLDLRFGEFGCEYANGAFHARLHFWNPGQLLVSCRQESDFTEYGRKTVASSATMYLRSEPVLLDRFIDEFKRIPGAPESEACLEAV